MEREDTPLKSTSLDEGAPTQAPQSLRPPQARLSSPPAAEQENGAGNGEEDRDSVNESDPGELDGHEGH